MAAPYGAHPPPYLDILDVPAHRPLIPWAGETHFFSLAQAHGGSTRPLATPNEHCDEHTRMDDDKAQSDNKQACPTRSACFHTFAIG